MTCPRCGAALARLEDDSNGWLRLTRAIFSCGHSQYVAAEPGPSREPERSMHDLEETTRPCVHCHRPLGRIRSANQIVHTACAPARDRALAVLRARRPRLPRAS